MSTPSPTAEQSLFTPEQRRRLGEVYRRILSWRQEDKKTGNDIQKPSPSAIPNQFALPDDVSSEDHSKGGDHG